MPTKNHKVPKLKFEVSKNLPPGTLVYVGNAKKDGVQYSVIQYDEHNFHEFKCNSINSLKNELKPNLKTWINIDGVHNVDEIKNIGILYSLNHLTLEDIANTKGRPKFEEFSDYIFIVVKDLFALNDEYFDKEQISFILKKNLVISFQEHEGDVFDSVRNRLRISNGKIRQRNSDYLLYCLLDSIVDNYIIISEGFDEHIDKVEEFLYASNFKSQLDDIKIAKKYFTLLRRTVNPMKELIYDMYRSEHELIDDSTTIYLRDLYDHAIRINDTVNQSHDKVYGLIGIYNSGSNNTMNNIMKTLTIVSTIFMALSLVAGIYGMNFSNMPELEYKYGYFITLGAMGFIVILLILLFKFKKWLD